MTEWSTDGPVLQMDLDVVQDRLRNLRAALPGVTVLYAVKANPAVEVVAALAELAADFDVASPGEIDLCLRLGIDPGRLSYGNTVKKERDVVQAVTAGVRRFTVDCTAELAKVLRALAGRPALPADAAWIFVRVATDGAGADWPLSKKFGCPPDEALALLTIAATAGLRVGLSFHVGSQQRSVDAWRSPSPSWPVSPAPSGPGGIGWPASTSAVGCPAPTWNRCRPSPPTVPRSAGR